MRTERLRLRWTRPWPAHAAHGLFKTRPAPPQLGHVVAVTTEPKIDCWARLSCPEPPQVVHVSAPVPGRAPEPPHVSQMASRGTSSFLSTPVKASSKGMVRSYRR